VSLDHRLREAADVKEMVIELLSDLNEALRDGIAAAPLHVSCVVMLTLRFQLSQS